MVTEVKLVLCIMIFITLLNVIIDMRKTKNLNIIENTIPYIIVILGNFLSLSFIFYYLYKIITKS